MIVYIKMLNDISYIYWSLFNQVTPTRIEYALFYSYFKYFVTLLTEWKILFCVLFCSL